MDSVVILGLIAGAVTSVGFVPQLIRGYKTKELGDVSYFMPAILSVGMSLWMLYGFFVQSFPILIANAFGIGCCVVLLVMKKIYSQIS